MTLGYTSAELPKVRALMTVLPSIVNPDSGNKASLPVGSAPFNVYRTVPASAKDVKLTCCALAYNPEIKSNEGGAAKLE